METTYAPTAAIETPNAPLQDPALLAAAGFLAGYSSPTKDGYTIDLRNYWIWCEANDLHVFEARRPHIELYVRSLEETRSEVQQVTVLGTATDGAFTLSFRRATTTDLTPDATAADVQAALEALPPIGLGNVVVDPGPTPGIWEVTFTGLLSRRPVTNLAPVSTGDLEVAVDKLKAGKAGYARSTIGRRPPARRPGGRLAQ